MESRQETTQERRSRSRSRDSMASRSRGLVTIVEEEAAEADGCQRVWPASPSVRSNRRSWLRSQEQHLAHKMQQSRRKGLVVGGAASSSSSARLVVVDGWLSPMSDHFPTPRGFHFMPAPILPATPSISSFDPADVRDDGEDDGVSCAGTDGTEFDDLCELSEGEAEDEAAARVLPRLIIPSRQASSTLATDGTDDGDSPAKSKGGDSAWTGCEMAQVASSTVALSPEALEMMERHVEGSLPGLSAPPSLDGSLDSDLLAGMSSPATPLLSPAAALEVRLEPAALATLRALSGEEDAEGVSDIRSVASDDSDDDDLSIESEDQGIIAIALEQSPPRTATLRLMTQLGGGRNSMPAVGSAPASAASGASGLGELTKLEIPSPNTFFAGLTSGSRHTWNAGQPASATPGASSPSSGAAERFYLAPWEVAAAMEPSATATSQYRKLWTSGPPVEHVVEVPAAVEDGANEPTARPPTTAVRVPDVPLASPGLRSNGDGLEAIEIILEADPVQARQQQSVALAQLDRMETWLAAQRAYLPTMMGPMDHVEESDTNEEEEEDDSADFYRQAMAATPPALLPPPPFRMSSGNNQPTDKPLPSLPSKEEVAAAAAAAAAAAVTTSSSSAPARKKSVRFSAAAKPAAAAAAAAAANNAKVPRELPATPYRQESAYYRAFVEHMIRQRAGDAYVHRQPRFEALQAQRATLRESHRRQLLGKFQLSVVPQSERQRRLSANVARGDDEPASPSDDDVARVRREQEAEAAEQMAASLWAVSAARMLAGGRLVRAPAAAARLARVSHMAPGPDSTPPRDRARILDLGGQASCDWAWHCAYAYPHTKIYTVTTRAARRLANSNMRGPPNHRTLAVDKLSRLPFADASFDLVSARELHALLKASGASGEDEWDACLAEVMRVLKPGGYLDFSLLDSDMISPGPRGLAKSVEFGFALKTLGYDPAPTRAFLGKLARAGFADVRRAWTCLPMGPRPGACPMGVSPVDPAAADNGSAVAAVAGLAASWSWERWLLRAETEKLASERQLCAAETATSGDAVRDAAARCLGDVHAIVDEGRACGAAWRMLAGWARKPAAGEGVVA